MTAYRTVLDCTPSVAAS